MAAPLSPRAFVEHVFTEHAQSTYLVDAATGRTLTYAQFRELAVRAAEALAARGVERGNTVSLVLENSIELAAMYFACLLLEATASPISPAASGPEAAYIVETTRAKVLVSNAASKRPLELLGREVVDVSALLADDAKRAVIHPERTTDHHVWTVHFTSGTTSRPKGVAHRAMGLLENAAAFNRLVGMGPQARMVHLMPMTYMAGFLNTLLCPFMAGASVLLCSQFDAKSALRFWPPLVEHRATAVWTSPTMLSSLLRLDRDEAGRAYAKAQMKLWCVGTAPLPLAVRREFESQYGVDLLESYGLSELLLLSGNSPKGPRVDGAVGALLPSVELRSVADDGEVLEPGADGEIQIRTPHLMAGYLDPANGAVSAADASAWFATGDVGHVDERGLVFITGRKKDMIIRGGMNVSPRAVEEALLEHPVVAQVAVVGLPHEFYGEEVVAVVKLKSGRTLASELASINTLVRSKLGQSSWPNRFVALDIFPESSNGKVQKNKLREQLIERPHGAENR